MTIEEIINDTKEQGAQASAFIKDIAANIREQHESEELDRLIVLAGSNGLQSSALLKELVSVMAELGYDETVLTEVETACAQQGTQSGVFVEAVAEVVAGAQDEPDFFGLRGNTGGSSFTLMYEWYDTDGADPLPLNIEYSQDGTDWKALNFERVEAEERVRFVSSVIELEENEVVYLRGNNPTGFNIYNLEDESAGARLAGIGTTGAPYAFGDVGTLIDSTGGDNTYYPFMCFSEMFYPLDYEEDTALASPPDLPSKNWEGVVDEAEDERYFIHPFMSMYTQTRFQMSNDGVNFVFKFGKPLPIVVKGGWEIDAKDIATTMGNANGFN